ncbi:MAG: DUF1893 domain-containing protein [bacterium]|nr:MAG: DUF1893 domain-containing protein [bacterium]
MKHSFEVYFEDNLVFYSDKNWIYPLFEFEEFIAENQYSAETLFVKDKIIGKAAALVLVHLKINKIHAKTLSRLGQEILDLFQITYSYDHLIDRIYCQTEVLLANISDPEKSYIMLKERAVGVKKNQ